MNFAASIFIISCYLFETLLHDISCITNGFLFSICLQVHKEIQYRPAGFPSSLILSIIETRNVPKLEEKRTKSGHLILFKANLVLTRMIGFQKHQLARSQ